MTIDGVVALGRAIHHRCLRLLATVAAMVLLLLPAAPAQALSAATLPAQPPANHVLDEASLLSRAASVDVSRALETLASDGVQASWISVPRLDYGVSLSQFGGDLLRRWQADTGTSAAPEQLLFLVDAQTSGTAIVATPALQERLSPQLLTSTARTTMAQPLRDGGRYRQGSLAAIDRLQTVLSGGEDPGPPQVASTAQVSPVSVPSREETLSSNAFTWVVVLLVVGTVVPMLTWWVFSR
ncbi:MAG: hypothetical protein RLZZ336_2218 [Cyanobacteriota bacterium]